MYGHYFVLINKHFSLGLKSPLSFMLIHILPLFGQFYDAKNCRVKTNLKKFHMSCNFFGGVSKQKRLLQNSVVSMKNGSFNRFSD